jgi:predicted ATPase
MGLEIFILWLYMIFERLVQIIHVNCAENFHTLALDNVPIFGAHNRTSAYRFVTLVDVSSQFSMSLEREGYVRVLCICC